MLTVIEGPFIEEGESLSSAIDCSAGEMVRITMPEAWDEAPLTFQFSTDGTFFNEMCSLDGYALTIPNVWPGSGVVIPADIGRAVAFIKFRSGTSGNPIKQGAGRIFAVAIKTGAPIAGGTQKKKAPANKTGAKKSVVKKSKR